jgi:hypothetical protein
MPPPCGALFEIRRRLPVVTFPRIRKFVVLTSSIALLGANLGPWLLQIPMPEATPFFKDTLEEPASRVLMLIGCGTLAAYGLAKRLRENQKAAGMAVPYSAPKRRAA